MRIPIRTLDIQVFKENFQLQIEEIWTVQEIKQQKARYWQGNDTWSDVKTPSKHIKSLPRYAVRSVKPKKHHQAAQFEACRDSVVHKLVYQEDHDNIYLSLGNTFLLSLRLLRNFLSDMLTSRPLFSKKILIIPFMSGLRRAYQIPKAKQQMQSTNHLWCETGLTSARHNVAIFPRYKIEVHST